MKTYSRLSVGRRRLSEYEIVSSDLHSNYPSRFELGDSTVVQWYRRYREGSRMAVQNWDAFRDPRMTTYRGYSSLQRSREDVVDGLFDEIDESAYDEGLDGRWISFLHKHYFPLRFPMHGLQMLAAYVGQMAPSSRITNCAAFQAADELRRMQRIAYRTAQLCAHRPGHDPGEHRVIWEEEASFQPLRELIERALVRYDWAESFVLLNAVIKPRLDRWVNDELGGSIAETNGDPILRSVHFSFGQDSKWHRDWAAAGLRVAVAEDPANAELIEGWIDQWRPLADAAVDALVAVTSQSPQPTDAGAVRSPVAATAEAEMATMLASHP